MDLPVLVHVDACGDGVLVHVEDQALVWQALRGQGCHVAAGSGAAMIDQALQDAEAIPDHDLCCGVLAAIGRPAVHELQGLAVGRPRREDDAAEADPAVGPGAGNPVYGAVGVHVDAARALLVVHVEDQALRRPALPWQRRDVAPAPATALHEALDEAHGIPEDILGDHVLVSVGLPAVHQGERLVVCGAWGKDGACNRHPVVRLAPGDVLHVALRRDINAVLALVVVHVEDELLRGPALRWQLGQGAPAAASQQALQDAQTGGCGVLGHPVDIAVGHPAVDKRDLLEVCLRCREVDAAEAQPSLVLRAGPPEDLAGRQDVHSGRFGLDVQVEDQPLARPALTRQEGNVLAPVARLHQGLNAAYAVCQGVLHVAVVAPVGVPAIGKRQSLVPRRGHPEGNARQADPSVAVTSGHPVDTAIRQDIYARGPLVIVQVEDETLLRPALRRQGGN
mmetsp:Transcript_31900/g.87823  ORF Transcript_31900/g.87823 Transcript_31900/m.87823 type:complete len:451 (-) Transcript_31900:1545-2897(-)